jgi:hypothetical protein
MVDSYHAPDDDGFSRSEQAYPGTSSKRMKTSFLCALATATMSSAPADGPPMRRNQSPRDGMENFVEDFIAGLLRACVLDKR